MAAADSPHIHDLLLDPNCTHPSYAEIVGIPPNWHESWGILYDTLKTLQESGYSPYAAISGLLHVEIVREQASALDSSSVDQLKPHLGTNYVPTGDEQKDIKQYIAQGGEKAAELFTLIDADRHRLISSYGRMAALNELMCPYFALASPIRRMPPEILQEIFVACIPTRHFPIMDASCAPLLLGRVCRAWRAISLSTPVLWSAVHVAVKRNPTDEAAEKLRVWLQRSGDYPLSISIVTVYGPDEPDSASIVDIIRTYSRRLKALVMSSGSGAHSILSNPPDLAVLEVLHILGHSPSTDSEDLQLLSKLPNLHDLSLRYGWTDEVSIPPCSWARFTNLSLESETEFFNLDVSQLMELVAQCVNLSSCRLSFPSFDNNGPDPTSALKHITLAHLGSLSMTGRLELDAGFNMAKILDALSLPALGELKVVEKDSGPVEYSSSVSDLLLTIDNLVVRSSCALRQLSIHSHFGEAQAIIQCLLLHGRTLTRLELERSVTYGQARVSSDLSPVLAALTITATSALCPTLRNLCIANFDSTAESPFIARALIESRCSLAVPGVSRLESADLVFLAYTLPNSTEFVAAMYPCQITIREPKVWQMDRAYGIPDDEREF
ncbi:hypothetical protein DFH06DRAFT_1479106 [Mycena polygramma]|nr:hypothetical protein DFH06DRAFT_1479106 [Mycena polygramma]